MAEFEPGYQKVDGVVVLRPKYLAEVFLDMGNNVDDPCKSARFLLRGIVCLNEAYAEHLKNIGINVHTP